MPQQKIKVSNYGSRIQRVLDALTPINGSMAPIVNAKYLGQIYIDEVNQVSYTAIAVGSQYPEEDWTTADTTTIYDDLFDSLKPAVGAVPPINLHAAYILILIINLYIWQ